MVNVCVCTLHIRACLFQLSSVVARHYGLLLAIHSMCVSVCLCVRMIYERTVTQVLPLATV